MPQRIRLLLAILVTIIVVAVYGMVDVHRARSAVPKPNPLRASMPAVAALPRSSSQPAKMTSRWPKSLDRRSELPPPSFVPTQFKNPKDLSVGKLLVSSRSLGDPNFAETVVLLVHYDEKGVVGLVLNRRTNLPISRVLDLKAAKDRTDPVYLGGPVELSSVFALLESPVKIDREENVFDAVYLISDKDRFEQTVSTRPDPSVFHVYLGYAGWTQDQLRAEVQLGAWFVFPADTNTVFNSDPDSLWQQMIEKTELHWANTESVEVVPHSPGLLR
jgi:putative AlgH/UPF0301 family transcriptional regulator